MLDMTTDYLQKVNLKFPINILTMQQHINIRQKYTYNTLIFKQNPAFYNNLDNNVVLLYMYFLF